MSNFKATPFKLLITMGSLGNRSNTMENLRLVLKYVSANKIVTVITG